MSPDGQWILHRGVYTRDTIKLVGICAYNTHTGESFLAFPNADKVTTDGFWSPDGLKFVFSAAPASTVTTGPHPAPKYEIYTIGFQPESFLKPASVADALPASFTITGNRPNPFNPSTAISFVLPK